MMTRNENPQLKLHCITIEDLVPQDHFLRKLEGTVDFSFIYDEFNGLYCEKNGRPGIDPVVLVKYLLIGYLYGIESERRIEREIQVNMAYRWFLGLDIDDSVPDHSTISQNRRRRTNGTNLYRRIFERVLLSCMEKGLVEGKTLLTDSTHVKAYASRRSERKVLVEKEAHVYMSRLDSYEIKERVRLEKKGMCIKRATKKKAPKPELREKTVSETDPDAGLLGRPGKPDGMHYLSHQSVDPRCGIIVDVAVTPGNVNDSTPYLDRVEYVTEKIGLPIEAVGVDSGYDISLVHKELREAGIRLFAPSQVKHSARKVEIDKSAFRYDKSEDKFVCPQGHCLALKKLERAAANIYRIYKANTKECRACPDYRNCVSKGQQSRTFRVNIFEEAVEENHRLGGREKHRSILRLRQIWCEGTFAAQKWGHNLRRLFRRGLRAAEEHCLLSATALNLKRMINALG